jgi:HSP20 family molecular chaperone IbpA
MQPVYAEIGVAQFRRSFVLSGDLDTSRIEAQVRNGVLKLRVPKHEQAKPRRIEVRAG